MKRDEKFYWTKALDALADHLTVIWGMPRPKQAPPATVQEIRNALEWAFLECWPQKGVDMWLDDDFESLLEPDED